MKSKNVIRVGLIVKYDELFDVSLKEVAINDNSNELPSILTNVTDNVMDTETNELPIKRAIKRPANHKDFYDDPSNLFEALSVADQDDLDKDWSPDEVEALEVDPVEYDKFKLYIEICERFNFSTYEGTLGANALLTGHGLTTQLITQGKFIRMKIYFGKLKIAAHKLRGPMLGLQVDAKEVIEALPNCKSHKINMFTMIRLPELTFDAHFKADGDSGEIIAKGCIEVIDETKSKDVALVTGSDGAPCNTSEDTG